MTFRIDDFDLKNVATINVNVLNLLKILHRMYIFLQSEPYIASMREAVQNTAAIAIRALAERHHVRYRQTALDVFGSHVTRLSGDDVTLDEPALLLLALRRAGHISSEEAARLHGDYLRAKYE